MAEIGQGSFQHTVSEYLIRHRSILDVQSKLTESVARVNRAIAKCVTTCGCISIKASRQRFPAEMSLAEVKSVVQTHVDGALCERCREIVETEIGTTLFYLAATASLLDLDLDAILRKEHERVATLGVFHLT
ncbi:MAG: DUF1573 domain-containing protein [Firmicutes bacterium]|jgi:hypothetical protein|nr:DUF1573 domain-containing protein [Bacillota bacterium]